MGTSASHHRNVGALHFGPVLRDDNEDFEAEKAKRLYANPIPSFEFRSGCKNKISFVQIETGFLCEIGCGDGAPVICLFTRRVIQQVGFCTQNMKTNVKYCCLAPRRECFAGPWTQASKPAQTNSNLAAKKRAEALHVVFIFNQASKTSTMVYCCCCCCWVYSRIISYGT